ncbi:barstar family protein [Actinoplanes sp. L3-i22]|uniref:barstar family protein n=1 Tax=Actinoplanes sp. L3-i22 TaxID=2836373 RepID=UPI001C7880B0|nr:barstar family protein [Actinoplanes sp. L3-i22]BCY06512.1 hypothetical protein L3i22_016000 [Actinoplanes sp. L3-i22]
MTDIDPPLRWVLLDWNTGDEERIVGSCAEIDGLFVDPPEVPLERIVLRDCVPAEGLRAALAGLGTERAHLGTILIEADDDPDIDYVDNLYDVTVLAAEGADVVLQGRIQEERAYWPAEEPPDDEGFRLSDAGERALGTARTVEGLYRERPELLPPAATLVGLLPEPWFRAALADGGDVEVRASVRARGAGGTDLSTLTHGLRGRVVAVRDSAAGPGLLDVELDDGLWDPIPASAKPLWDAWLVAPPAEPDTWTGLSPWMRHEWLRLALAHAHLRGPDRPAGGTYHLDGRYVTDMNAFFCAIGEAVNGPGGYFGWVWDALRDCLGGGWGAETPFRLVWSHVEVAREHLGDETVDELVAEMARHQVEVTR